MQPATHLPADKPKSFFKVRLMAWLRAFDAAWEELLEGEESGNMLVLMVGVTVVLGGDENVMLVFIEVG